MAFLKLVITLIEDFFAPASGSLKNHLNVSELVRVLITSVLSGGGVLGFLGALLPSLGLIFPIPQDAALATGVLTAVSEIIRRLSHGAAPPTAKSYF